jgi:hypothetical protein
MANMKMRLDFSKTEERSGWNSSQIAAGLHEVKIESVEKTEAGDGTDMLVFALVPTAKELKARRFPFYCKIQANQMWKLRDLLVAAGIEVPKKAISIDPQKVVGKLIAAEFEDDNYQGKERSSVQAVYGLDILDEDGSIAPDDDEDEVDDEADEADEVEDDEDDTEEDEDEEEQPALEDMSLTDLRKLAKELGLTTTGLKKPALIEAIAEAEEEAEEEEDSDDEDELDEDDLGDEELDEDEEEDEEEEPEPAPARKRPAAKAKPAAKAAAPAAAKRTVRRR